MEMFSIHFEQNTMYKIGTKAPKKTKNGDLISGAIFFWSPHKSNYAKCYQK